MPDPDYLFKLCTLKYVYIRDAKLGILKFSLMGLIFVYVVVYNILMSNVHLEPYSAQGFGAIHISHPTVDCKPLDKGCHAKFHSIAELPYCKQIVGSVPDEFEVVKEERRLPDMEEMSALKIGDLMVNPKMCRYLDNRRIMWSGGAPSETFIPTRYRQVKQKLNKDCYNPELHENVEGGTEAYRCKTPWETVEENEYYIADIENFMLSLSHSFSAPAIGAFGVSTEKQGVFAACPNNHPADVNTECKRAKVPGSTADSSPGMAPEDEEGLTSADDLGIPSLRANSDGLDEISLGDLLRVTPVAQDYKIKESVFDAKLPEDFGHKEETLRDVGGMLLLDVDYSNVGTSRPGIPGLPFGQLKPITYLYRPYFIPSTSNTRSQLIQASDDADERVIDVWYGLTVKMQFNGQLVVFSWSELLTALTSGLVLLTAATTLVTYLAIYVLPNKEKYNQLIFQTSEDFTNYKTMRDNNGGKSPEDWKKRGSTFASGAILEEYIGADGNPTQVMTNEDIVNFLVIAETRLNRMDGMDTRMVYDGVNPEYGKDGVGKLVAKVEKDFYKKNGVANPDTHTE